jgi:hypothetical protein
MSKNILFLSVANPVTHMLAKHAVYCDGMTIYDERMIT